MTKAKRYKRYSSEFKREAILRAGEEGVPKELFQKILAMIDDLRRRPAPA